MSTEYKGYRSVLSALDAFDEFLDDVYGTSVTVAGYEYCVSRVLKAVDTLPDDD